VRPRSDQEDPDRVAALAGRLGALPEVEFAQLDLQWVQRLYAITEIARRGTYLIAALLAAAVLLIVGNTIRLEIQNRREEIAITKLVGGTDAFVRRPFLYHGFWLGLLGGSVSWLLVHTGTGVLEPSVTRLAELYHSGFRLLLPGLPEAAALLGGGALVGWLGAWVAVGRHIRDIEPD
jgi:cell division transport system permease protein